MQVMYGTSLGYYQATGSSKMEAVEVDIWMVCCPDGTDVVSLNILDYYTQNPVYVSGPLDLLSGYMTISCQ